MLSVLEVCDLRELVVISPPVQIIVWHQVERYLQASWMHSSTGFLVKDGRPPALATWLHSTNAGKMADASSAHSEQPAQPAAASETSPVPAAAAPASALEKGQNQPQQKRAETSEAESESDNEEDIGPDDWDDILAVWMSAVGLPNFKEDGQPDNASETTETSFEEEFISGTRAHHSVMLLMLPCQCGRNLQLRTST